MEPRNTPQKIFCLICSLGAPELCENKPKRILITWKRDKRKECDMESSKRCVKLLSLIFIIRCLTKSNLIRMRKWQEKKCACKRKNKGIKVAATDGISVPSIPITMGSRILQTNIFVLIGHCNRSHFRTNLKTSRLWTNVSAFHTSRGMFYIFLNLWKSWTFRLNETGFPRWWFYPGNQELYVHTEGTASAGLHWETLVSDRLESGLWWLLFTSFGA